MTPSRKTQPMTDLPNVQPESRSETVLAAPDKI